MLAKAGLWAPILSLFGPNSRNIRPNYLLIQRFSRAQHRSNEVVLEGLFSEVRRHGVLGSPVPTPTESGVKEGGYQEVSKPAFIVVRFLATNVDLQDVELRYA